MGAYYIGIVWYLHYLHYLHYLQYWYVLYYFVSLLYIYAYLHTSITSFIALPCLHITCTNNTLPLATLNTQLTS